MPVDTNTSLEIRVSVLETKEEMLLDKCDQATWKSENMLQEVEKLLARKDKQIDDLTEKLYKLAGAVKKLAVAEGRLPGTPIKQKKK